VTQISRDAAIAAFARARGLEGSGFTDREICEHFDFLNPDGFLDFRYDENGDLRVLLTGRKSRQ
jgi:hypothetical protein